MSHDSHDRRAQHAEVIVGDGVTHASVVVARSRPSWSSDVDDRSDDPQRRIDLLGDADPAVRLASVMALGEDRHAPAAPALVERCGRERDFQIREALTWATLRIGDPALPLVRDAVVDDRWLSRLQAAHTLSKIGDPDDAPRLLPVVDDPVDCVAARAYWAAAQCGDAVAVPALVEQLGRGTTEHRTSLLVALSHFGADAVGPLAAALRRGATGDVRAHAADTLAYLPAALLRPAEDALVTALADDDEAVRVAALNALGQLDTRGAWDLVEAEVDAAGRVGLLARRLAERRPADAHLASSSPPVSDEVEGTIGRRWPAPDLGLVTITDGPLGERLHPMLAAQVAVCGPTHLARADVPGHELAAVRDHALTEALGAGRDPDLAARMADGAVEQHVHDTVLLEQISVAEPGKLVKDLLYGTGIHVLDFARPTPPRSR